MCLDINDRQDDWNHLPICTLYISLQPADAILALALRQITEGEQLAQLCETVTRFREQPVHISLVYYS